MMGIAEDTQIVNQFFIVDKNHLPKIKLSPLSIFANGLEARAIWQKKPPVLAQNSPNKRFSMQTEFEKEYFNKKTHFFLSLVSLLSPRKRGKYKISVYLSRNKLPLSFSSHLCDCHLM